MANGSDVEYEGRTGGDEAIAKALEVVFPVEVPIAWVEVIHRTGAARHNLVPRMLKVHQPTV